MLPSELYDMMPVILGGICVLLGLLQFLFPKMMTAKKFRDDPEKVDKIKKGGIPMIIIGIACLVMQVLLFDMQM